MKAYFFSSALAVMIAFADQASAEVGQAAMEASKWITSLSESQLKEISAPKIIAVVESFEKDDQQTGMPKFKEFPSLNCKKFSFLECANPSDANFAVLLNSGAPVKGIVGAFGLTGAEAVVYTKDKNNFLSIDSGKTNLPLKGKLKDLSKSDTKDLTEAVLTTLGYDGVVLAVSGDYVLVGSSEARLKRVNLQGLALTDSSKKLSLATVQKKGASLLSLVNSAGPYGVFQHVVGAGKSESLLPGTKILLESK